MCPSKNFQVLLFAFEGIIQLLRVPLIDQRILVSRNEDNQCFHIYLFHILNDIQFIDIILTSLLDIRPQFAKDAREYAAY